MADRWLQIFRKAKPVPCGNPWDTLSGDDRQRFCADCNRQVHNLTALTPESFDALQAGHPDRLCVVLEKPPRRFLPMFAKPFAAAVAFILVCQLAGAQEKKEPELWRCEDYLYTPIFIFPGTQCLDEKGQPTEANPWLKKEYKKREKRQKKKESAD